MFTLRGGDIMATVTGRRRYSSDLAQGGLEIPCKLKFCGKAKEFLKLKRVWHHKNCLQQLHNYLYKPWQYNIPLTSIIIAVYCIHDCICVKMIKLFKSNFCVLNPRLQNLIS